MSPEIIRKIQYLCNSIAHFEWSGVLFYTCQGTIQQPDKMTINIEDILPMDKGTATATEFAYDERYVNYLMNNPERLEWRNGLIHSHNNMAVFFSGTDEKEIETNSKAHNYYLSMVVNNKLDIIAKVGFVAEVEYPVKAKYHALDENGKSYFVKQENFTEKRQKLFTYDCKINYNIPDSGLDTEFIDNVAFIMKPKPVVTPTGNRVYGTSYNWDDYEYGNYPQSNFQNRIPPVTPITDSKQFVQKPERLFNNFRKTSEDLKYEQFLLICFGYSKSHVKDLDFEECMQDMQEAMSKGEFDQDYLENFFCDTLAEELEDFIIEQGEEEAWVEEQIRLTLIDYTSRYPFINKLYNMIYDAKLQ